MTYEEFKKELYRNLLQQEETQNKQIKLFERKSICADIKDLAIIKALNLSCYGMPDLMVHEDVICVLWGPKERNGMLHWKVRPLYERYKKEGWQGILPELVLKIEHVGKSSKILFLESGTYEEHSDRLIIRPVNWNYHRQSLDNCIYWRQGDIALVLYGLISDEGKDYITMKMHREITKQWNIPDNNLIMNALLNCYAKMPPRLLRAEELMVRPGPEQGVFMPGDKGIPATIDKKNKEAGIRGYRLTTTRQLNGALAIFYPGVKERLAELLGEDYYIGFTSVHEAVIHPISCKNPDDMKEAIQHVNAIFEEEDMLTNRVFRYSRKRREMVEV